LIDDIAGTTLVAASSLEKDIKDQTKSTGNIESARLVGQLVAKKALEKGIEEVTFDRGGNIYHELIKKAIRPGITTGELDQIAKPLLNYC
jgi:large subunit ribosomal protein L18